MFFSLDQELNGTFDAQLAALRRLTSFCKFAQLEEELIRDRIVLSKRDSDSQAGILKEPSLKLQSWTKYLRQTLVFLSNSAL